MAMCEKSQTLEFFIVCFILLYYVILSLLNNLAIHFLWLTHIIS